MYIHVFDMNQYEPSRKKFIKLYDQRKSAYVIASVRQHSPVLSDDNSFNLFGLLILWLLSDYTNRES